MRWTIEFFLPRSLLLLSSTSNWTPNVLNIELRYSQNEKQINTHKVFLIFTGCDKLSRTNKFASSAWISEKLNCIRLEQQNPMLTYWVVPIRFLEVASLEQVAPWEILDTPLWWKLIWIKTNTNWTFETAQFTDIFNILWRYKPYTYQYTLNNVDTDVIWAQLNKWFNWNPTEGSVGKSCLTGSSYWVCYFTHLNSLAMKLTLVNVY